MKEGMVVDTRVLLDSLVPLVFCHLVPGFLGGLLLITYRVRENEYRSKAVTRAFCDLVGATIVGLLAGPLISALFSLQIPEGATLVKALHELPRWLTFRWGISALFGCFWIPVFKEAKSGVTRWVKKQIEKLTSEGG